MASVTTRSWVTPSGKRRKGVEVDWRDENGKRRHKLFTGDKARGAAADFKLALDIAKRAGKSTAPVAAPAADAVATVRQAGARWVRYSERELGLERSTWKAYERHLDLHICPTLIARADRSTVAFGDLAILEVTAPECEALKDALLKRLSPKNARKVLTSVKMLFNDSIRRPGGPAANPALAIKIKTGARHERPVKIPPKDELRRIIAAARTEAPAAPTLAEVYTMVTLFSGLRPSENRGAALEDLVLEGKKPGIQVCRRADQWQQIGAVKSGSGRRFVPLPPEAVAILKRWLLVVPRGHGFKDAESGKTLHLLFPTSIGTVLPHSSLHNLVWLPVMAKAGLVSFEKRTRYQNGHALPQGKTVPLATPRYPVNALRHLCASLKIEKGIDPKKLQQEMGHSSIQVTFDNYGHLFTDREGDNAIVAGIAKDLLA